MMALGPLFADITWSQAHSSSAATTSFVKTAHADMGLETCMHLTCTNMQVSQIESALKEAYDSGCHNILALRGDPPHGGGEWTAVEGGFSHAIDLVKFVRKNYGDHFDIGVAGYPEGHPQSTGIDDEMRHLKLKVDAGSNFIITQMFYDADVFIKWARRVRAEGITVPIVPGIMPIQTYQSFLRRTKFSETVVPKELLDALEPIQEDDQKVRDVGTKFVAEMCRKILDAEGLDIWGVHCYTMNLSRGTELLLEELNFVPTSDVLKPLPWRVSLTSKRRTETTRPIFWSNRQRSYLSRTADWDEFPNGRWGDTRSPAFGEPTLTILPEKEKAVDMWGNPTSLPDVTRLFAKFCRGGLDMLPWSDAPRAKETTAISEHLAKINEAGFLTINSQPRVDGATSNHPLYGWGPRNGYVYQKAYLEFFASPQHVHLLLDLIETKPNLIYHAVNKQGELLTNAGTGPNAVTWGVFPASEIIQPTVVDGVAFMAWKDEAFSIGEAWGAMYKNSSPASAELISGVMNTYYLVNIVDDDFRNPDEFAIFSPFMTLLKHEKRGTLTNGSIANGFASP